MRTYRLVESQMQNFGAYIAQGLKAGDVVCLHGDLGAGKSTLARTIIHSLAGKVSVPSPTFTLVQVYEGKSCPIWHMDWYRLQDADEVYELGIEEAFCTAITLIEWSERASSYIPKNHIDITITGTGDSRTISIIAQDKEHAYMHTWGG